MNANLPPNGPPYDVDDETRSYLESVLTISAGVADLQHDDECRNDIYTLLDEVADRFFIEKHHIEFDSDTTPIVGDRNQRIPLYGVQFTNTKQPNLTLVPNDAREEDDGSSNIVDINSFNNKGSKSETEPEGPSG